jgi:hypothetical protein
MTTPLAPPPIDDRELLRRLGRLPRIVYIRDAADRDYRHAPDNTVFDWRDISTGEHFTSDDIPLPVTITFDKRRT